MTKIAEVVKQVRDEFGFKTQDDLAKKVGVSQQAIQKIEAGKTPQPRCLIDIARALNLDPFDLMDGKITRLKNLCVINIEDKRAYRLPVLELPSIIEWLNKGSYEGDKMDFKIVYSEKDLDKNAFIIKVVGDAMSPQLLEGTFVVVEPELMAQDGDIVLINTEETFAIRELSKQLGQRFIAANPKHPPIELTEKTKIVGVITQSINYYKKNR